MLNPLCLSLAKNGIHGGMGIARRSRIALRAVARPLSTSPSCQLFRNTRATEDDDEAGVESSVGAAPDNDFILSILSSSPSIRDSKAYLSSFSAPPSTSASAVDPSAISLFPPSPQTALVKLQGPFNDRQLESISRGLVYLQRLGLVTILIVDSDEWIGRGGGERQKREEVAREIERIGDAIRRLGSETRPILQTPFIVSDSGMTLESDMVSVITGSVLAGEIPILPPLAMSDMKTIRVEANEVIRALTSGLVKAGNSGDSISTSALTPTLTSPISPLPSSTATSPTSQSLDLTPSRLMIINREGGIPSYARPGGLPHLTINLKSEYSFIHRTFQNSWKKSHPSALSNLALANDCLKLMPRNSSALVVSHRTPRALIANLITNKPTFSSSLPNSLLDVSKKLTPHTPTLIRQGLEIKIFRDHAEIDQDKMTMLLEKSFRRKLDRKKFFNRLEKHIDFVIVAGDYAGAAIVTREWERDGEDQAIAYLDKFAVLPKHQGDGTVDFLWVALRDESFGAAKYDAANPNPGSKGGTRHSKGKDLVWRSRSDNPVNKWYFERSNGFLRVGGEYGKWKMFWCDREQAGKGVSVVDDLRDSGSRKLERWADIIEPIESVWTD